MNIVKEHFEQEAVEFDRIILRLIPYYTEMVDALVSALPSDYGQTRINSGCIGASGGA